MSQNSQAPILLTGAHRSGKSFFAKAICLSGKVARITEPLNKRTRPGIGGLRPTHAFQYIDHDNSSLFERHLRASLQYKYRLRDELACCNGLKDYLRIAKDLPISLFNSAANKRPLIDDPFAVVSAEWFHATLGMDVVIMIRHPASFVASLVARGYRFNFAEFLEQNRLMQAHLLSFADEIREYSVSEKPIVDQGILLWRIIYSIVAKYEKSYRSRWLFIKFEDLAKHGEPEFVLAFEKLNLTFGHAAQSRLERFLSAPNYHEAHGEHVTRHIVGFGRPIEMQMRYFELILGESEIRRIKDGARDVWPIFYSESDW